MNRLSHSLALPAVCIVILVWLKTAGLLIMPWWLVLLPVWAPLTIEVLYLAAIGYLTVNAATVVRVNHEEQNGK